MGNYHARFGSGEKAEIISKPYLSTYVDFRKEDHIRLRNTLAGIQGKFLLSYNDCEYINEIYADFNIEKVERSHNLKMGSKENTYPEVIISNYDTGERARTIPKQFNFLNNTDTENAYE